MTTATSDVDRRERRFVEREARGERVARRFEKPVLVATVLLIPTIIVEASQPSPALKSAALVMNWLIWLVLAAEMVALLAVAPSRRRWLRQNPLTVVIVFVTVPFLPASLQAARFFRLARLVRLVLVLRLARRLLSPEGLQFAAAMVGLAVLGGASAFTAAERTTADPPTMLDGVWWAMATVTTVGYGDIDATTTLGRFIGMALMVIGIGFVALLTGAIAQQFLQPGVERVEAAEERIEAGELDIAEEFRDLADRLARLEARVAQANRGEGAASG